MNELVKVEEKQIPEIFKAGGIDSILKSIRDSVGSVVYDVGTAKGRKEIASQAAKVARSKTYLDGLGKDYVAVLKEKPKVVDAERKKMRDDLDAFKEEVRAPLTEWERKEKDRKDAILRRCNRFRELKELPYTDSVQVAESIAEIELVTVDESFAEYQTFGLTNKDEALTHLKAKLIVLKDEEEKAEEFRLSEIKRKAKEQEEREALIAKQAADKATREAEERTQAKIDAAESKVVEVREEAKKERVNYITNTTRQVREEIKEEGTKELEAQKLREDDKKHKRALNKAAMSAFVFRGMTEEQAKLAVTLIAKGEIPNISINY